MAKISGRNTVTGRRLGRIRIAAATFLIGLMAASANQGAEARWRIVLHGGAGVIERKKLDARTEAAYRAALAHALQQGADILARGGSAVDAVEAAIKPMEDDPLFNAGRGAVFDAVGRNELDAAIMDGSNLKAGAVAAVTRTRHPISLARAVMEKSKHVMLIGDGADAFSRQVGLEQVDPSFFFTEKRWRELEQELKAAGLPIPPRPAGAPKPVAVSAAVMRDEHRFGTVGVVVLDTHGHIAAGTSTGGLTAKQWGRVGDSPIIGAGTYASDSSCAVSGTGTGEYFIRLGIAREVCDLVHFRGMKLQQAADEVIHKELEGLHGDGGLIAVDPQGEMAWSFNTEGMYRARVAEGEPMKVEIYGDEK
jgi:beta-aspartyl-peptidase (threonine type)